MPEECFNTDVQPVFFEESLNESSIEVPLRTQFKTSAYKAQASWECDLKRGYKSEISW